MTRRRLWLAVAFTLVAGREVAAQDGRLVARFTPEIASRIQRLVDSAGAAGLPGEPLVLKALEGETKGAAPERIVAAVRALFGRFLLARERIGPAGEEDLVAAALWLQVGGHPAALAEFRADGANRRLAVPLSVAAELVARGWPAADAASGVRTLLRAGVADGALIEMRRRIDRAVREGASVGTTARDEVARLTTESRGRP